MKIGIVGGTGPLGKGLALRWSQAGHAVYVGSRAAEKAAQAVAELRQALAAAGGAQARLEPATNAEAAARGEVVVLAVPAAASPEFLDSLRPALRGKVLIDCTVDLDPADITRVRGGGPPAARRLQEQLGDEVTVVAGFHTVAAAKLADLGRTLQDDAFFAADDPQAKDRAMELAREIGLRAFDAGPLDQAGTLERITALLIGLNKRYKRRMIGIKLTGI